ncbi:hypothetical protein EGR_11263 [Echinococcus granulosus]|uniref:Uncharacterized protein n=1 Tax=Echinococcus granulosus TaxID=6210 RepID=W6UK46_ECHGR|nr:hypothetical protein EGR_11263 [Echinococcus granulosus]EUB53884.1 hypothetical protein EGR_11263 [Echinococcus granulosus]
MQINIYLDNINSSFKWSLLPPTEIVASTHDSLARSFNHLLTSVQGIKIAYDFAVCSG